MIAIYKHTNFDLIKNLKAAINLKIILKCLWKIYKYNNVK